jgi:beta-galactosidase
MWEENYIVDLFDWHLHISENDPDFVGNVQWLLRILQHHCIQKMIFYMNQKKGMDRRKPKGMRNTFLKVIGEPFAGIESHTWTERQGEKESSESSELHTVIATKDFVS